MVVVSKAHKSLVIPFRADVANVIPLARTFDFGGERKLVVPHGLDETILLRNLGISAPAPILTHYDWAGGTPYDVQRKTAALLTTNLRAHCLNGMGTGKTKAALWSADFLKLEVKINRVLVVAPLSTLADVWYREIFRTIPHRSAVILHGTRERRLKLLAEEHDFYIVNHDGVGVIKEELLARTDIDAVILDEAAVYRNNQAIRTKLMRKITEGRKVVWGLTGSPTPQAPTDAFAQARIITPWTVAGVSFTMFRDQVMYKQGPFVWREKQDATERIAEILSPAVRYTLDDVVELPEIVYQHETVPLSPNAAKIYKKLSKEMLAQLTGGEVSAVNEGVLRNKLLQVACGWAYGADGKCIEIDAHHPRLEKLIEVVEACARKVIVFCPFTEPMKNISKHLTKAGLKNEMIWGGTSQVQRGTIFQQFRADPKMKAIVAHPGTMAHGLTLTEADTIIWFSPTSSLETFEQANARIRRIGQKSKQLIVMLGGTDVERKTYRDLERKQKFQNSLLDLLQEETATHE